MNNRRAEVAEDRTIVGIWQQIPAPMISRFLAQMHWDWIILDMQHGSFNWQCAYECIHIIRAAGAKPLVRVGIGQTMEVQKALDLGAGGIIVPMVNSQAEAVAMAAAAKYPPLGERSIGGDLRYHYGESYADNANEETILLVQIEHILAVENAEAILSVPGVDGCFVGPTDLAVSMGLPRTGFDNIPELRQAIQKTADVCRKLGKVAAINSYSVAEAREKNSQGFSCITMRSDADLFIESARALLGSLRERPAEATA